MAERAAEQAKTAAASADNAVPLTPKEVVDVLNKAYVGKGVSGKILDNTKELDKLVKGGKGYTFQFDDKLSAFIADNPGLVPDRIKRQYQKYQKGGKRRTPKRRQRSKHTTRRR